MTPQGSLDLLFTDEEIDYLLANGLPIQQEVVEVKQADDLSLKFTDEEIDSMLANGAPIQNEVVEVKQADDLNLQFTDEEIDYMLTNGAPIKNEVLDVKLPEPRMKVEICESYDLPKSDIPQESFEGVSCQALAVKQPDKEKDPERQRNRQKIKIEIGRFYELPKSEIPPEAFEPEGASCHVLAVDTLGYVFIGFPHQVYETVHDEAMVQLNYIYRNLDRNLDRTLSIVNKDQEMEIDVGEILVGKSLSQAFLRVQVLEIIPSRQVVRAVDIDDQQEQEFHFSKLYWMTEHFFRIPMKGVKCRLALLEEFVGTSVITGAVRTCEITNFKMVVKVEDDEVDDNSKQFPKVVLYQTQWELETRNWSFNSDLIEIIGDWNRAPFDFNGDMILPKTRITHVVDIGEVFVQFQSSLMDILSNIQPLEDLSTVDTDHILNNVIALRRTGKDVFVTKVDGKFRRVRVQDFVKGTGCPSSAIFHHIDYGRLTIGNLQELIPFSYFPEILEKVPPQGFEAILQKPNDLRLSQDDTDRLLFAVDIKITFQETPTVNSVPIIMVYFPKRERRLHLPCQVSTERPERPDSRCSNTSSYVSSNYSSSDPRTKSSYERFLLPIVDTEERRLKKFPGRQFEYDYDQGFRNKYISHVALFDYENIGRN